MIFHKFGKVQKDGYQYCEKCGKARVAPCIHDWLCIHKIVTWAWGDPSGYTLIYECQKCKAIRREKL